MKPCNTQKSTTCKQGVAHEYISENYKHYGDQEQSLLDWLVRHCSPNINIIYYTDDDCDRPQSNPNDVSY